MGIRPLAIRGNLRNTYSCIDTLDCGVSGFALQKVFRAKGRRVSGEGRGSGIDNLGHCARLP